MRIYPMELLNLTLEISLRVKNTTVLELKNGQMVLNTVVFGSMVNQQVCQLLLVHFLQREKLLIPEIRDCIDNGQCTRTFSRKK